MPVAAAAIPVIAGTNAWGRIKSWVINAILAVMLVLVCLGVMLYGVKAFGPAITCTTPSPQKSHSYFSQMFYFFYTEVPDTELDSSCTKAKNIIDSFDVTMTKHYEHLKRCIYEQSKALFVVWFISPCIPSSMQSKKKPSSGFRAGVVMLLLLLLPLVLNYMWNDSDVENATFTKAPLTKAPLPEVPLSDDPNVVCQHIQRYKIKFDLCNKVAPENLSLAETWLSWRPVTNQVKKEYSWKDLSLAENQEELQKLKKEAAITARAAIMYANQQAAEKNENPPKKNISLPPMADLSTSIWWNIVLFWCKCLFICGFSEMLLCLVDWYEDSTDADDLMNSWHQKLYTWTFWCQRFSTSVTYVQKLITLIFWCRKLFTSIFWCQRFSISVTFVQGKWQSMTDFLGKCKESSDKKKKVRKDPLYKPPSAVPQENPSRRCSQRLVDIANKTKRLNVTYKH